MLARNRLKHFVFRTECHDIDEIPKASEKTSRKISLPFLMRPISPALHRADAEMDRNDGAKGGDLRNGEVAFAWRRWQANMVWEVQGHDGMMAFSELRREIPLI